MNPIPVKISGEILLRNALEDLYDAYQDDYLAMDPLELVRRYDDPRDQEIAAFVAAGLAIGQYDLIRRAVRGVLDCMQPSPYRFVRDFNPKKQSGLFVDFKYRFYRARDIQLLISWMAQMIREAGSIREFFLDTYSENDPDIGPGLSRFVRSVLALDPAPFYPDIPRKGSGIRHFLADPEDGSACKRLNLFLRWMVRRDALDLGLWPEISTARLVIPLDTHIARFGRYLGLTRRHASGWHMALDITASLRRFDPVDPVKYDFALCTLGKLSDCSDPPNPIACRVCPVFRFCGHGTGA